MSRARLAVIPAAGLGTRMLPETEAVPKELLPVGGRPMIDYALSEAFGAGIEQVIVVSSPRKPELSSYLMSRRETNSRAARASARTDRSSSSPPPIRIVEQTAPSGLGDAVRVARDAIGREPFAVLLPDELILGGGALLERMLDEQERSGRSVVSVVEVGENEISSYGCARTVGQSEGGLILASGFVEKPSPLVAPSRLALTGRYVLCDDVLARLGEIDADQTGEVQLTAALNLAASGDPLACVEVREDDGRLDVGNWTGWLRANELVARDGRTSSRGGEPPGSPGYFTCRQAEGWG